MSCLHHLIFANGKGLRFQWVGSMQSFIFYFFAEPKANAFIHIRAQYGALWQSKLK